MVRTLNASLPLDLYALARKSLYTHRGQVLVKAAVVYDALAINQHGRSWASAKSFTATRKLESRMRLSRARRPRKRLAC